MEGRVQGRVLSVIKLGGIKTINQVKFPYLIIVEYAVNGEAYKKVKYVEMGATCPQQGDYVVVIYKIEKPSKCRIKR